jgi:hypothetical protein
MDFSIGIRQEHLDSVYIFNASLEILFQTAAEIINKIKKCWHPHCINESSECVYFRCTRCLTALYCGKEHQALNWKQHKTLCSQISVLTRLLEISKLPFNGHYDFHFSLDDFSDETKEMKRTEAMDEFMIKHGIYASKPLQKRAFEKLLAHFVVNPDWIKWVTDITGHGESFRTHFPQSFKDTVAGKALLEACLKLESGASNAIIDFNEMEEISSMSLSLLPFWASQILPDMAINWYIQVNASFTQRLYGAGGWTKLGPSNDLSVFSHQNGSSVVFYEDSCSLLCNLSTDKSYCKRFSGWKVRILVMQLK